MLHIVKSPIQTALSKLGLSVRLVKPEPYQELWDVPRYGAHREPA